MKCIALRADRKVAEENIRKYCSEFHADKPELVIVLPNTSKGVKELEKSLSTFSLIFMSRFLQEDISVEYHLARKRKFRA